MSKPFEEMSFEEQVADLEDSARQGEVVNFHAKPVVKAIMESHGTELHVRALIAILRNARPRIFWDAEQQERERTLRRKAEKLDYGAHHAWSGMSLEPGKSEVPVC